MAESERAAIAASGVTKEKTEQVATGTPASVASPTETSTSSADFAFGSPRWKAPPDRSSWPHSIVTGARPTGCIPKSASRPRAPAKPAFKQAVRKMAAPFGSVGSGVAAGSFHDAETAGAPSRTTVATASATLSTAAASRARSRVFPHLRAGAIARQASIRPSTEETDVSKAARSSPFSSISITRSTPSAPITQGTPT